MSLKFYKCLKKWIRLLGKRSSLSLQFFGTVGDAIITAITLLSGTVNIFVESVEDLQTRMLLNEKSYKVLLSKR